MIYEYRCAEGHVAEHSHPMGKAPEWCECDRCGWASVRIVSLPQLITRPRKDGDHIKAARWNLGRDQKERNEAQRKIEKEMDEKYARIDRMFPQDKTPSLTDIYYGRD